MSTNPNMEAIETITVGATSVASITFSNIPQGYTDLKIVASTRGDTASGVINLSFNGVTSNLSGKTLFGNGNTAFSQSPASTIPVQSGWSTATTSTFGNVEFYIPNYTSSNYKSVSADAVAENNATEGYNWFTAGLWSNTAAITSVTLTSNSSNFVQYSSATLYGITNAAVGAKATGGIISETDTHYIHTFTASGTFTPTSNITADYLVVAGGGGGGFNIGGGGGAGGLRCTVGATGGGGSLESALSLTASTNYTVTVGAGGAGGTSGKGSNGNNSIFSTITSIAGGGGGARTGGGGEPPNTGGSGGGGSGETGNQAGAAGTSGQGNAGGTGKESAGSTFRFAGAGGGGGGAVGVDGDPTTNAVAGAGGAGVTTSISGSSVTYAGGGGGGAGYNLTQTSVFGAGGSGGGGRGGSRSQSLAAVAGTANTGGGGGGADNVFDSTGKAGGSGIVIVRYAK